MGGEGVLVSMPGLRIARDAPLTYNVGVCGDVAQLGERRTRIAEVGSSNLLVSTSSPGLDKRPGIFFLPFARV